jgi:hypothetical protein
LIVSISTIEHVGYDDNIDPNKIFEAINKLKSMLNENGRLIISFPMGYNKYLDNIYEKLPFNYSYFKRVTYSDWEQIEDIEGVNKTWDVKYPGNNLLVIGECQNGPVEDYIIAHFRILRKGLKENVKGGFK